MRAALLTLVAIPGLLIGCTSNGPSSPASGGISTPAPMSTAPGNPNNHLTGIGATTANWNAHHDADPDPKLVKNCCYGPLINTDDDKGVDTWAAVQADPIVSLYLRSFPAGTTRDQALSLLTAQDMPSDAKFVNSKIGDGCELFLYSSNLLAAADPDIGSKFAFDLHSGGTDLSRYDPTDISGADMSLADDLGSC